MSTLAELDLHVEGTLEPEYLVKLQAKNADAQTENLDDIRKKYSFSNLQDFLSL
ncbi:MAG: hypothetical protein LBP35_05205 [Candidatus Ancillula trichonymphae]|jgi:adenosine deaminase|nr:hypothetical protein [Candidatus Ancillula trichonymphae]